VRTGGEPAETLRKVHAAMELFLLLFLLFLALTSVFGLTADSREWTGRVPFDAHPGPRSGPC
jgi:uncharacterized iron-regulated membrane protein